MFVISIRCFVKTNSEGFATPYETSDHPTIKRGEKVGWNMNWERFKT